MPPRRTRSGSARAKPGFFQRHSNVYAYVPNLIGYARVVLAAVALRVAFDDVPTSLALYLLSFVCDELDGRFARMFDQCSEFGKLLDMVRVVFPITAPPNPPIHAPIDLLPPIERCITRRKTDCQLDPAPDRHPQVTDRLATTGLLMVLSREYPPWFFTCVALVALDIGSHWLQMYAQLLKNRTSHKDVDKSSFFILRL
jgi:CDP-diacylglycerol--inositol 3-phosphatidyltransferase